jgi:hypothetical protein
MSETPSAFEAYIRNAEVMAGRAIKAREQIYQGIRESRSDFLLSRRRGRVVHDETDTKQKFLTSARAKGLISDNRWHMSQAIMYSVLALARGCAGLLLESKKQTMLMQNMDNNIAEVLNEVRGRRDS